MPKTKNKQGIHLYKTIKNVWNKRKGYSTFRAAFYWRIIGKNGSVIAQSSEAYTRKSGAVRSIKVVAQLFYFQLQDNGQPAYYDHSKPDSPLQSYL